VKILVTGATGMLGKEIVNKGRGVGISMVAKSHEELDITDMGTVESVLSGEKPDILINCAGIVRGRSDNNSKTFYAVNGEGPAKLAALCDHHGIKMVQSSTDCVFNGDKPHVESDKPNALDIYGKSKIQGEIDRPPHLTTRCSFIGFGKRGLLSWLTSQEGEVYGYVNSLWNGLTVSYAAQNIIDFAIKDVTGIVHLFGKDTTKYDILMAANEAFKLGLNIIPINKPVEDHRLRTEKRYHIVVPTIEVQIDELRGRFKGIVGTMINGEAF